MALQDVEDLALVVVDVKGRADARRVFALDEGKASLRISAREQYSLSVPENIEGLPLSLDCDFRLVGNCCVPWEWLVHSGKMV